MKVAKWGNSLAIRLPAELAARPGIKEGDELQATELADGLIVKRQLTRGSNMTRVEAIANLRKFRGRLPADFKFNREWAKSRDSDDE